MTDPQFPIEEQQRRFGFAWDSLTGFEPYLNFWSFYEKLVAVAPSGSTIVEVGCYHGRSLICLGMFAREANKGLHIVGVDNDTMHCNQVLRENLHKAGLYGNIVHMSDQDSVTAAQGARDGCLFAVFIDGGHVHDEVNADIHAWMPKVQPGGWIAGHDFLMFTVHQPVCALFGERLIYDERWQDVWIVPKCEPYAGVDIRKQWEPWPPAWRTWEPQEE